MANYWAITIGINQYQHFQPLMHAQDDALLTHRFLTEEAGIAADHCVLLSDLTTSVTERAVYPDKPAIAQWLQTITQQVRADDTVWVFFSGYGAQVEGQDYLMPIDGDPEQAETTGISAAGLIETLTQLPTENRLLILDINRSQGALAGQTIGAEILELAESRSLTTFLSCQPEQYSHETLGVRHGLFTAALLEAVHQKRRTPAQLSEYLNKRLPELCEHHWRPIQNPAVVFTDAQAHVELVPEQQSTLATNLPAAKIDAMRTVDYDDDYSEKSATSSDSVSTGMAVGVGAAAGATALATDPLSAKGLSAEDGGAQPRLIQPPYTEETIATGSYRSRDELTPVDKGWNGSGRDSFTPDEGLDNAEDEPMGVTGAKLRNWGLLALALLMGGVLLKQPFVQTAWQGLGERLNRADNNQMDDSAAPAEGADVDTATDAPSGGSAEGSSEGSAPTAETATDASEAEGSAETAATEGTETDVTDSNQPDSVSGDEASNETTAAETTAAETNAETANESSAESSTAADVEAEKAAAQALIAQANAAIEQRQYSEALIALQDVPRSQRDATFSAVLTKARKGSAEAQQTNASVLTEARTSIQPTQASQFTEAIAKARLIQPGEPYYEAAQRDIRSWSQVILDIAEGRATSGNLDGAIAAADVMPQDNAELHQKAQDRIAFWQQRQNSRQLIAEAQTIPKLGQASTYQKGIVKLREVPIEHPEYETAQRLADQWSQSIFSIAQARAAQGRQNAAIQAAILVPAGTTAYEPTQQAIRRWKNES